MKLGCKDHENTVKWGGGCAGSSHAHKAPPKRQPGDDASLAATELNRYKTNEGMRTVPHPLRAHARLLVHAQGTGAGTPRWMGVSTKHHTGLCAGQACFCVRARQHNM